MVVARVERRSSASSHDDGERCLNGVTDAEGKIGAGRVR
jgi:hypothetical protein